MKRLLIAASVLLVSLLPAAAWQSAAGGEEAARTPQPRKLRVVVIGAHCDDPESRGRRTDRLAHPRRA